MFKQVLDIQRDRQQFQSVEATEKKHIKRWQTTERWQEGHQEQRPRAAGGQPATDAEMRPQ